MLLLLLIWVIFGGAFFLTGHALLILLRLEKHFPRSYDRTFVAIWLGIALFAPVLLALSIVVALKPFVALILCGIIICLSLGYTTNRRAVLNCVREISLPAVVGTLLIAFGVSAYTSQFITLTDSGLYHLQAIRWLAEYGTVPGVALIHDRLGFTSSWFALAASLDHGVLRGHIYASLGGFVLFMMIHALGVGLSGMAAATARREDYFLAGAFALSVPPILFWRMGVSPSPDLPVIVLSIVVAWIYLQGANMPAAQSVLDIRLLPLLLSLAAVTAKLSAVPLLVATCLCYCLSGAARIRRLILAGCLVSVFLLPQMIVSTITSGYPLFPSSLISFDLPWTLPADAVRETERVIQEWARWGGRPTPPGGNAWNWILPWITEHIYYSLGLMVSCTGVAIMVRQRGRAVGAQPAPASQPEAAERCVIAVAIVGLSFSMWKAPDLRFALGYLVIVPALLFTARMRLALPQWVMPWQKIVILPVFGGVVIFFVLLHSCCISLPSYAKLTEAINQGGLQTTSSPTVNWLLPPEVLSFYWKRTGEKRGDYVCECLSYLKESTADLVYYRPEIEDAGECWVSPLPCAPGKLTNVTLRSPTEGLNAGFVLSAASQRGVRVQENQPRSTRRALHGRHQ